MSTNQCPPQGRVDPANTKELYQEILDTVVNGVWTTDKDDRIFYANRAMSRIAGVPMDRIVGIHILTGFPESTLHYFRPLYLKAREAMQPLRYEAIPVTTLGGRNMFQSGWLIPRSKAGFYDGMICTVEDATERRWAEEKILQNKARLESLLNITMYNAVNVQDLLDFALLEAIRLSDSKIGYIYHYYEDRQEFVLNSWSPEAMQECAIVEKQTVYQLARTGIWGEAVRQRRAIVINDFAAPSPLKKGYPAGHVHLHRYMTVPVFSGEKIVAVAAVANKEQDYDQEDVQQLMLLMNSVWGIVERRKAEMALQLSEERWRDLFNRSPGAIAVYEAVDQGRDFIFKDFNPASESVDHIRREDVVGRPVTEIFPGVAEFGLLDVFRRVWQSGRDEFHDASFYKDGRISGWRENTVYRLNTGEVVAMYDDVTERKQYEQKLADKNAELERFTYTISHDLKSPLVTIKTFLGYLQEDLAKSDRVLIDRDIGYIQVAANKMGQLLEELLRMSKVGLVVNKPEKVTCKELVDEALGLVAGAISAKKIDVRMGESAIILHGDRCRLVEIWQNLVENACKYMGEQSAPSIEIGSEVRDGQTMFFVRDNGMGIDPRYRDKVFGMFEKLDPGSEGTGLGLALVKRIVGLYGGVIWVESPGLGQGASFYFTLPEAVGYIG